MTKKPARGGSSDHSHTYSEPPPIKTNETTWHVQLTNVQIENHLFNSNNWDIRGHIPHARGNGNTLC